MYQVRSDISQYIKILRVSDSIERISAYKWLIYGHLSDEQVTDKFGGLFRHRYPVGVTYYMNISIDGDGACHMNHCNEWSDGAHPVTVVTHQQEGDW